MTATFSKGTRLKLTQTGVKYFVVVGSSFGGGNTTVTITGGSDYTLANAAISANYYSYAVNPQGYPDWFQYTVTETGFSGTPDLRGRFAVHGLVAYLYFYASGTSDSTSFELSLPVAASSSLGFNTLAIVKVQDNSAASISGIARIQQSATVIEFFKTYDYGVFTASGTKSCQGEIFYRI